jgi:hypothetical protein
LSSGNNSSTGVGVVHMLVADDDGRLHFLGRSPDEWPAYVAAASDPIPMHTKRL